MHRLRNTSCFEWTVYGILLLYLSFLTILDKDEELTFSLEMKEELPVEVRPETDNITKKDTTEAVEHDLKEDSDNEMLITSRYTF